MRPETLGFRLVSLGFRKLEEATDYTGASGELMNLLWTISLRISRCLL